jgi:hypothetical protein
MVFGSITLASRWEPFQWAVETLSEIYANQPDLIDSTKSIWILLVENNLIPMPLLLLQLHARLTLALSVQMELKRTFVQGFM